MIRTVPVLVLLAACDLAELSEGGPGADDDAASAAIDAATDDATPQPGAAGSCDPAAWVATASAMHPTNPPRHAIDGLAPSRWSTGAAQHAGDYIQLDFGGVVTLDRVTLTHAYATDGVTDYPRGLDVLGSSDGTSFTRTLAQVSHSADPGAAVAIELPAAQVRAVRLALTESAEIPWWTIHELTLGCTTEAVPGPGPDAGTGGGDPVVDLARTGWSATAGITAAGDAVALAFDGNPGTRWATGKAPQFGDEWYRLDLGAVTTIRQVRLRASATDYPSAYALELSTDDVTYQEVARGLGAETTQIDVAPRAARYLLIKQIGSGHDHWWGINDLAVAR